MSGTSPPGRRWCQRTCLIRQKIKSLKTTAPAYTCLQIRFCSFSGIWSRNQEVVEPNPLHPNESTCYSNLFHCDRDGVYLYIDMAMKQIAQAMAQNKDDP